MQLIFVYNADSGLFNALSDWAHKTLSPDTYACNLCALTYSNLGMRRTWRQFIRNLEQPVEFLHRDELAVRYGVTDVPLPAIFNKIEGKLNVWLSTHDINRVKTLAELQSMVVARLEKSTNR